MSVGGREEGTWGKVWVQLRNLQGWLAEFSEQVGEWHHGGHGDAGTDGDMQDLKGLKEGHFRTPVGPLESCLGGPTPHNSQQNTMYSHPSLK